jgi:hypothetical protein
MVNITVQGTSEPLCCWLRPAPDNLDINLHCTYNKILEAVRIQQWYPANCHYCAYRARHVSDYETHVVKRHPGKPAYPGPTPEKVARALYIVESIERELKEVKKSSQKSAATAKTKSRTKTKSERVTVDVPFEVSHAGS